MRSLKAGEESRVVTQRVTSTLLLEFKSYQKQWPSAAMFPRPYCSTFPPFERECRFAQTNVKSFQNSIADGRGRPFYLWLVSPTRELPPRSDGPPSFRSSKLPLGYTKQITLYLQKKTCWQSSQWVVVSLDFPASKIVNRTLVKETPAFLQGQRLISVKHRNNEHGKRQ